MEVLSDGEMGTLIRAMDWSKTPLGPIMGWPQSLRTAVSLCLSSNFPINIVWGPQHTQIYNDSYRLCCGDAHPRALGEDYCVTWASAWPAIGESFEQALAGKTKYLENQRMFLKRLAGGLEETFFTFSHSPIQDESGGVGGLFHPVTETTATMLSERRNRALRDLSVSLGLAEDEEEVAARTVEVLSGFEFDLPFLLYYCFDPDSGTYKLTAHCGVRDGLPLTAATIPVDGAEPWPFSEALRTRQIIEAPTPPLPDNEPCGPYPEAPSRAFVLPVVVPAAERLPAVIVAGASSRLPTTDAYRSLYRLLAVTIANALATVRAREDERRRAEALAEIDRAKTLFFSNVSHEFRTPLTLMLGPLEEVLRRPSLAGAEREQLTVAHRNSLRLLKLVNSLLDFSRVEAGRAQAVYQATDLAAATADLASNFRSACERAGLRLTVDCPPLPEPVHVDRDMWEKIVLNLVSNAFKFTLDGEIEVALRARDGQAELTVRDTGTGIPESELPHMFERFHRVESARGRTHEGSGIGLALVQELVKLHGGTIEVASISGEGTTFTVRAPFGTAHLPADRIGATRTQASTALRAEAFVEEALRWLPGADAAPPLDEFSRADPSAPLVRARSRVLFADDNADMRDYVRRILASRHELEIVADGQAALDAARTRRPDLIVADVMMPRLDGVGLLRAIRSAPELREIPVVMLSARAGEEAKVEGLEAGADDYLVKPFSARELLARIESNLEMSRIRREATEALRESEARHRAMFDAIDEGACIIEPLPLRPDGRRDYRYVVMNPAMRAMFGIPDLTGQSIRDNFPEEVEDWYDDYDRVLKTGEAVRFERESAPQGMVLEMFVSRIGEVPGRLLVVMRDVTERKRREENLAFLAEVSQDLAGLTNIEATMNRLGAKIGGHFNAPHVAFAEVDEAQQAVTINHAWNRPDLPSLRGVYRIGDFHAEDFQRASRAGETYVVRDAAIDPRVNAEAMAALNILSFISAPLLREMRWLFQLTVSSPTRRDWREDEIELMRELTTRIWTRLERARAEERLRDSEEQLRLATEAADMGLWDVDPVNDKLFWPARVKAMAGISPEVPVSMADFHAGLHPQDRERTSAAFADALDPEKRALYDVEYRTIGKEDGIVRWVAAKGRGVFDNGICVRVIGTAVDITNRKRAEAHRDMLIDELNHRVKNTLAIVQSFASQTLRNAKSTAEARDIFDSRLMALARAHDVLTREHWTGADLNQVVSEAIAAYSRDGRAARFQVDGPELRLQPKSALALSMALHELATNAVKYGALSNGTGAVEISWRVLQDEEQRFRLRWIEAGGPSVERPRRRGFGSRLVEHGLAQDLAGEVRLDFERTGLVCTIEASLAEIAGGNELAS